MKVTLAGYNVDASHFDVPLGPDALGRIMVVEQLLTPETISAAYARISRSDKSVGELRKEAKCEVEKARGSNRSIVFEMNHASVAEHAVLNFDIEGISRIALEELERYRLASFTEKSQRYVTLKGDFVMPEEFGQNEQQEFKCLVQKQSDLYFRLLEPLTNRQKELHPEKNKRDWENLAKEDARYVLSLATEGQVGCTFNARELEKIIREFKYHHLSEVRELGKRLYSEARKVVPSLVIMADENEFESATGKILDDRYLTEQRGNLQRANFSLILEMMAKIKLLKTEAGPLDRRIVNFDAENLDRKIISALISSNTQYDLKLSEEIYAGMSKKLREGYIKTILSNLGPHDALPRAFEMGNFTFEALVSASCYAQLKRHRMCTQLPGSYDPALGVEVPQSIRDINMEKDFQEVMGSSQDLFARLKEHHDVYIAKYCLTNAHRRKVIVGMNLREMYHFSRLREDGHAQWEIRELAHELSGLVKKAAPLAAALLGGKDQFEKVEGEFYGR